VNLNSANTKLSEARFFLDELQEHRAAATSGNPRKPNSQSFAYYLSAFVSAARSVTWILKAGQTEKYKAWLDGWEERRRISAEDNGIEDIDDWLKLTNEMRLDVAKREGQVKTRIETEMVPVTLPSWENNGYQINILLLGLTLEDGARLTSSETHYIDGTDQEVVKCCERYVSDLEARLRHVNERFWLAVVSFSQKGISQRNA
jgi:hypothetical protein